METLECIKNRRSVRSYHQEPISDEILKNIVDCGRLAATALNIQPWKFVVIRDKEKLKDIAQTTDHGPFIGEAAACIAVLCEDTKYYLEDGSAATENILIAARDYGIGSCWVAGDKKPYADDILKKLNAPQGYKLVSLISLGYCDFPEQKDKKTVEEVTHWESF